MLTSCKHHLSFVLHLNHNDLAMRTLAFALLLSATGTLCAQDNVQKTYYASGVVKEMAWQSGDLVSVVRFHENGRVAERGAYAHGNPEGTWKAYDASGKLTSKVRFVQGQRQGNWMTTSPDGNTVCRVKYNHGKMVNGALTTGLEMVAERQVH